MTFTGRRQRRRPATTSRIRSPVFSARTARENPPPCGPSSAWTNAEKTKEEEARRRVADERARIARELHHVVAHHLALANAQAGTVSHLMDSDPGKARAMARDLGGTIVAALEELKTTVGPAGPSDAAARQRRRPAPACRAGPVARHRPASCR
jgi:signal transduction histidine kinase